MSRGAGAHHADSVLCGRAGKYCGGLAPGRDPGTPEELIRFVDQVLRDHVRGAGLRLSQAGPGTAPLLEPDHCAGPVSK